MRRHIPEAPDGPELIGLSDAVGAARDLEQALGGQASWGLIEGVLVTCASVEEAVEVCVKLPEQFTDRAGRVTPIREGTARLVRAYARLEPAFAEQVWPRHRTAIGQVEAALTSRLLPKQSACFEDVLQHLAMRDPRLTIPVYLVAEAPAPGAFTHRRRGGGGVCFVSADSGDAALLPEIVLHETIHALDIATAEEPTALQVLRNRLREAGLDPNRPLFRDVPHTLMFVQAGETVRRILDPAHRHYGDAAGYYAKVPVATDAVRANWMAYLDGKCARDAALTRIAERTAAAAPAPD